MSISALSPELLKGFYTEARGYVAAVRQSLSAPQNDRTLPEIHQRLSIVADSAEMLGVEAIFNVASPAVSELTAMIDTGAVLSEPDRARLLTVLDQIETVIGQPETPAAPVA